MGNNYSLPQNIDAVNGKLAIVTGASSGIGLETARVLAQHGAHVIMAVRNLEKALPLVARLQKDSKGKVEAELVDLESLESVRSFAKAFVQRHTSLDLLINNAGIMTPATFWRSPDGFDMQMASNHYGHFLLTVQLLPLLIATAGSRVINVSSIMHKFISSSEEFKKNFDSEIAYEPSKGYARTKLANLLFTRALATRLRAAGHSSPLVVAAHPGYTSTNLQYANKSALQRFGYSIGNALVSQSVEMGGESPTLPSCAHTHYHHSHSLCSHILPSQSLTSLDVNLSPPHIEPWWYSPCVRVTCSQPSTSHVAGLCGPGRG